MTPQPQQFHPDRVSIPWQIGITTTGRMFINTARRFAYPFASVLAKGLGVPLQAITVMIAGLQAVNVLGGMMGPLGDRRGYRTMMLAGMALLAGGMLLGAVVPVYIAVLIGIALASLGKSIFDPALQAYLGLRIPYHRRGLAIGITEISWAGSAIIGIPLLSILVDRTDWRAPFWALGAFGVLAFVATAWAIPGRKKVAADAPLLNYRATWGQVLVSMPALGALGFAFFSSMANDSIFVTYGIWLESRFGLGIVALGMATSVIGAAELTGESVTAFLADRIGLRPAVIGGAVLSALSYGLLPVISTTLPLALTGLFLVFVSFEFTYVTALSLFTEVLPTARSTMMASVQAVAGVGRVFGALMGGFLWLTGGSLLVGLVSLGVTVLGLAILLWGMYSR